MRGRAKYTRIRILASLVLLLTSFLGLVQGAAADQWTDVGTQPGTAEGGGLILDGFLDWEYLHYGTRVDYGSNTYPTAESTVYILDTSNPNYLQAFPAGNDQKVWIAIIIGLGFVDNSYYGTAENTAANYNYVHPSWNHKHPIGDFLNSDQQEIQLYNTCGVNVLDLYMDYIQEVEGGSTADPYPSGLYSSQTNAYGDTKTVYINGQWTQVAWTTSLAGNLNKLGYCVAGNCSNSSTLTPKTNLLFSSPHWGTPTPAPYPGPWTWPTSWTPETGYSNWEYRVIYEVAIDQSVFNTAGCTSSINPYATQLLNLHVSPPKTAIDQPPVTPVGLVGDFVWFDANNNGVYEPGLGEYPISGVVVNLYYGTNTSGPIMATTETDSNGLYYFSDLPLGTSSTDPRYYTTMVAISNFLSGGALFGDTQTYDNTMPPLGSLDNTSTSMGLYVGGPTSDLSLDFGYYVKPEFVELGPTSLTPGKGGVVVKWMTGLEISNIGFNIMRSTSDDYSTAMQVNGAMIPTKAFGTIGGASYSFLDKTALEWRPYFYWLQDVSANNQYADVDGYSGVHALGSGSWNMPQLLALMPLNTSRTIDQRVNFLSNYRDLDGDLATVYLLVADKPDPNLGLAVKYDVRTGLLSIYANRLHRWLPGIAPMSNVTLSSAYGRLLGDGTWVSMLDDGNVARVSYRVRFWANMIGTKNVYMKADDIPGNSTGWVWRGTWTVLPGAN